MLPLLIGTVIIFFFYYVLGSAHIVADLYSAVWHQADPITKGTRWALVIFYKVESL